MLLLSACSFDQASLEHRQDQARDADKNNSPIIIGIAFLTALYIVSGSFKRGY